MEPRCLPLPPLGANCYLLRAPGRDQCLLLDPGGDAETLIAQCRALGTAPAAILLTHGHFDHVGAVSGLTARWPGLPVYCHPGDVDPAASQWTWTGGPGWQRISDNDSLSLAGFQLRVLHTPGHSPGSVCYLTEDCLFTGDTLFRSSVGRVDLPGGDEGQMAASLRRLASLPGDYRVYPGHDAPTALDRERERNPYLRGLSI